MGNNSLNLKSYEYLNELIERMPLIFYILDKDWNFLLSTGQGLEKMGLKPGEVVGENVKEMYKDNPDILEQIDKVFSGNVIMYEQILGEQFLDDYMAPFYNEKGEVEGLFGLSIDVTDRKINEIELAKTRALYEAFMESVPGMMYMYNESNELVFWNKYHETITGFSKEELYHKSIFDWYEDDYESLEKVKEGIEKAIKTGYGEAEVNIKCKDGSLLPTFTTASPLLLDGKTYFVGIGVDISSRVEAESKLQELNKTLEVKVEKRTKELKKANQDLFDLNHELRNNNENLTALNEEVTAMNAELFDNNEKLKSMQEYIIESEKMASLGGLVAGVAHEVNTPIGVGLTASTHLSDLSRELIHLNEKGNLTKEDLISYIEDVDEASRIISKNLNTAANLVKSFKQLSVDQSSEPKRRFEIGTYIDETLISLSPSLKRTNIKINTNFPEEIIMNGFPGSIAQIITNLVMNAVKHAYKAGDKGQIYIEAKKKNEMVKIIFQDDGKGMDKETLSKMYDPFFTTNRTLGGTGLGLTVVYSIVTQQYKGTIQCYSELYKGTKYEIEIKENI